MASRISAPSSLLSRNDADLPTPFVPADVPRPALIIGGILSMLTISLLVLFLTSRIRSIPSRRFTKLPLTHYLVIAIYIDSTIFVLVTAILSHGWGINFSDGICAAAILLCLICYMSTKLVYYFLMEKVYIIRGISKPRHKSKLYLFNTFGVLTPFAGVVVLNFIYRINRFDNGTCIIGMERQVLMPLIIYDLIINVWLTTLFIIPLRSLYSYQNNLNSTLKVIALRTFIGSIVTLISSVVNLTVLMVLSGEPAWICLMCCNTDILISAVVIYWVTSKDSVSGSTNDTCSGGQNTNPYRGTENGKSNFHEEQVQKSTITTKITARPAASGSEEDVSDIRHDQGGELRKLGSNNIPLRNIEVRTDYTMEVTQAARTSAASVDEIMRERADKASEKSTEDLVYRR